MNCNTCGAAVESAADFCHHCRAPVGDEPAVDVGVAKSPIRLMFEASALGLFGRSLLLGLSFPFLFPVPWTISWFWKWFAEEVRAGGGESFQFWGAAANVWKIALLYVLLVGGSISLSFLRRQDDPDPWLFVGDILIQGLSLALGWTFTKWFLDHLELRGKRWRFDGSIWGFVGWNLLIYVSFLTIIGWAWAMAGLYHWIASHVQDAGGTLQFIGAGHQILWRTLAMILFFLPIVTIPWAIKWYYAWLINQLEFTPTAEA